MKQSILDYLRKNNIEINAACNGLGSCGKCKIKLDKSFEVDDADIRLLGKEEIAKGYRLSCMHFIDESQEEAVIAEYFKNTDIKENEKKANVILSESFIPKFNHNKVSDRYGIALDIGTTTMAMQLVSLKDACVTAKATATNPQVSYGFDVMSRIAYTMENQNGLEDLQKSMINTLNILIDRLIEETGIPRDDIAEFAVSANTTMSHILLGESIESLGKYPFAPVFTKSKTVSAFELGLNLSKTCKLVTLPHISAFVGSDIVSGAYAADICADGSKGNILFIDIGTNGEMILKSGSKLTATSCAVGPALEGMNISCGMRADIGAIDNFSIDEDGIRYTTIGNEKAVGICGSGVLAMLRELLKNEVISKRGAIIKKEKLEPDDYRLKFISVDEEEKAFINIGDGLYFSAKDIRQVQLAKGAILSGIICLTQKAGLRLCDIDRVYIAGQFGKYISQDSLFGVGLLPMEFLGKVEYLGNTSLSGAYLLLLDDRAIASMDEISRNVEFFELSRFEGYERIFTKALMFG